MRDAGPERPGSEVVVEVLKRHHVTDVFGCVDAADIPLLRHTRSAVGIRVRSMQLTGSAMHAALAYARVAGRTAVVMAPAGPAALALAQGILGAQFDSTPIVVLGVSPAPVAGRRLAECDMMGVTNPIAKHNLMARTAADVEGRLERAFEIAESGRPGPVYVELTHESLVGTTGAVWAGAPDMNVRGAERGVDMHAISRVWMLLRSAKRPLIVAGQGAVLADAAAEIREFSVNTGIPTATTLMAKGLFDESDPLCAGCIGAESSAAAELVSSDADVVIAFGCRFREQTVGSPERFSKGKMFIQIDIDPSQIGKHVPVHVALQCDARDAADALLDTAEAEVGRRWSGWTQQVRNARRAELRSREAHRTGAFEALERPTPTRLDRAKAFELIDAVVEDDDVIVLGGWGNQLSAQDLSRRFPRRLVSSGPGLRGFALPAAVGASAAAPDDRVWVIETPRGVRASVPELAAVAAAAGRVVVLVINDDEDAVVPSTAALADAYGFPTEEADEVGTAWDALQRASAAEHSLVLTLQVEPDSGDDVA